MGSWAIKGLNFVLFGGCCFLVAKVVTQIGAEALEPGPLDTASRSQPVAEESQQRRAAPSVILDRNLFGAQLAGDAQARVETREPLTKTKLPLRLLGTAAATREDRSRAAIEDEKTRKHMVVAIGDRIVGHTRVRVDAIERTRVILDNAGKPEELVLFEDQPARVVKPASRPTQQARRRPSRRSGGVNDRLKQLQGSDGDGISRLLSQARIVPHYDQDAPGELLGMAISAIKPDSLFESAGLQDGDVITEVNGIVIDRQEATGAVFQELMNSETIEISALRGDSAIKLSADAADLMEQP